MSITFPNSPSVGDTHVAENGFNYEYDGEKWSTLPDAEGQVPAGGTTGQFLSKVNNSDYNMEWTNAAPPTSIGETPPSGPLEDGQLWWKSDTGVLYIYYGDGDSSQWVQATLGSESDSTLSVPRTSFTGSAEIPAGTTSERDSVPSEGYLRYNTTENKFEGYSNNQWAAIAGGVEEAPTDGNQYARTNSGWAIVSGGGGGSSTAIPQNVAIIADVKSSSSNGGGNVIGWQDRTLNTVISDAYNLVTLSNDKEFTLSAGTYLIEWAVPGYRVDRHTAKLTNVTNGTTEAFGSSSYSGTADAVATNSVGSCRVSITTDTTYKIEQYTASTNATFGLGVSSGISGTDSIYSQVTITDLSIVGGSGTVANSNIYGTAKAWGSFNASGGTISATNLSATSSSAGIYSVSFDTAMADNKYTVVATSSYNPNNVVTDCITANKTTTGFTVYVNQSGSGASQYNSFDVVVYDETPAEISLTTFGDVINYSGAAAWGTFDGSNGLLLNGLNCTTARIATGAYEVTFVTPMPNANYAVNVTPQSAGASKSAYTTIATTANSFVIRTVDANGSAVDTAGAAFSVYALNALPPKGGTGTDAWASVEIDGTLDASFNVASVTKTSTGNYAVVFTTPMPTSSYAVQLTAEKAPGIALNGIVDLKTTDGFRATIYKSADGTSNDGAFDFTVNCTNATLPQTVTQEQIESAINSPGASAWGRINSDATIAGGLNTAGVTNSTVDSNTGYNVTFTTPMPSADYSVTASALNSNRVVVIKTQDANGFRVELRNSSNNGVTDDFNFTVFATNALPPKGSTGTDSWVNCDPNGNILASFNTDSVTRTSTGIYDVAFATPMPTSSYAVNVTSGNSNCTTACYGQTAAGYTVAFRNQASGSALVDQYFSTSVNATNATLPQTVTQEQIESAVNNPGASAWATVDENGNLLNGLNVDPNIGVTGADGSVYTVRFLTPMPDASYSVVATCLDSIASKTVALYDTDASGAFEKAPYGFAYYTSDSNDASNAAAAVSFQVFATNALPPKRGTGNDAWGSCANDGALNASFNVASVTRTATGEYDVVLSSPMPTADYSVIATAQSVARKAAVGSKTVNGFTCYISENGSSTPQNASFDFSVNATNATLPTSFTEAQIQSVLDFIAVANPAGVAKAWGSCEDDGTIDASFNVASVTKTNDGKYEILFTTPMPTSKYAINATIDETPTSGTTKYVYYFNRTTLGFTIRTKSPNTFEDLPFSFTVHSN